MFMVDNTVYFNSQGHVNTETTIDRAVEYAVENDIQAVVIAATEGESAFKLKEEADKKGYKGRLCAVTYHEGFRKSGQQVMPPENREKLEELGFKVQMATHALSSIERSFRLKWQGISLIETVAETLRIFGRGVKVGVEISLMAADGGLIPDIEKDIVVIAGSSRGADTAIVMRAAYQNTFLQDMRIRKILCKPANF